MPTIKPAILPATPLLTEGKEIQPESKFLGTMDRLEDAFPSRILPDYLRGALPGEGILSAFNARLDDNYLYSLNAQTCIIMTLYNPANTAGAVVHFDHNISSLIDDAVATILAKLDAPRGSGLISTLSGGVWLMGGESIGETVKNSLRKYDIHPSWQQWSLSPCLVHNYGVVLDLEQGGVDVFEHSISTLDRFLTPLLSEASRSRQSRPEIQRANTFMARFRLPAIAEGYAGLHYADGRSRGKITESDINNFHINIHSMI